MSETELLVGVVIGADVPTNVPEEEQNAYAIAEWYEGKGKKARVFLDNQLARLPYYAFSTTVLLGGPIANKDTAILDPYCNPNLEKAYDEEGNMIPEDSQFVYTKDGEVYTYPLIGHGIIGFKQKARPRLGVYTVYGYSMENTTAVVKAFLNQEGIGVYRTDGRSYTKIA